MPGTQRIKILFAGGCHVVGYPAGKSYAFPAVVGSELFKAGVQSDIECVGYLPLHHSAKITEACRRIRPDILVLQVTNYELGNELSEFIRSRLGLRVKSKKRRGKNDMVPA